jgi:hypothetical protein
MSAVWPSCGARSRRRSLDPERGGPIVVGFAIVPATAARLQPADANRSPLGSQAAPAR